MKKSREERIFNLNPSLIGTVKGFKFYEHPLYGDEEPLMVVTPDKEFLEFTEFYELPTIDDIELWLNYK
tara:strand:- start:208 stop:414 length:207 start_codon:yes stop_codon:yes gene_type:complete